MSKKEIPLKVTNSFFYTKNSTVPLPALVTVTRKAGAEAHRKVFPKTNSTFLRDFNKSVDDLIK